jgi:acyl carrier protein
MPVNDAVKSKYLMSVHVSNDNAKDDPIDFMVRDLLSEKLGVDFHRIKNDASMIDDLGIDSLDFIDTIMELEKVFKVKINDEESERLRTVEDITNLIKLKMK